MLILKYLCLPPRLEEDTNVSITKQINKMKKRLLSSILLVLAMMLPTTLLAQATVGDETLEPYAVLSENNTVLTFYYDGQKAARNGLDVGPFSWYDKERWGGHYPDLVSVIFDDTIPITP